MFRTLAAALLVAVIATANAQTPQLPPQQQVPRQQTPLPTPQLQLGTYVYTARTAVNVRRSGAVAASGITWACQGTTCTVTGPWPQPGVAACTALAREVGRIVSYGRQGAMLAPAQITQCNTPLSSPPPPPAPSPPPPPPPPPPTPPPPPPPPPSGPAPVAVASSELSLVGGGTSAPAGGDASGAIVAITSGELSLAGGAIAPIAPPSTEPVAITSSELSLVGQ